MAAATHVYQSDETLACQAAASLVNIKIGRLVVGCFESQIEDFE
jgi:hypothetical protein